MGAQPPWTSKIYGFKLLLPQWVLTPPHEETIETPLLNIIHPPPPPPPIPRFKMHPLSPIFKMLV